MTTSKPNPKVDWFFTKAKQWQEEYKTLRTILLGCGLTEELKWGCPCYQSEGSNIILIHGFKDYCALLFMKGALLKDPLDILVQQTQNVQAARQIRFANLADINQHQEALASYLQDAIAVEKSGAKVAMKSASQFEVPPEFAQQLDERPELAEAFHALTPGRQKAYLLHFAGAKQAPTREARVAKHVPRILNGLGLDDRE